MTDDKLIESKVYVFVPIATKPPPGTVEILSDAGIDYAVLRKSDLPPDLEAKAKPAFEIAATGEVVVPTGKVTVRWDSNASVLDELLKNGEAALERDYGKGGIVASPGSTDPVALAERLEGIKGITRTEVQTLRKAVQR